MPPKVSPEYRAVSQDERDDGWCAVFRDGEASPQDEPTELDVAHNVDMLNRRREPTENERFVSIFPNTVDMLNLRREPTERESFLAMWNCMKAAFWCQGSVCVIVNWFFILIFAYYACLLLGWMFGSLNHNFMLMLSSRIHVHR